MTAAATLIREIATSGTPFDRGRQFGAACAPAIHSLLARIGPLDSDSLLAHAAFVERFLPSIADEVHGLSIGADIDIDDAFALQMRRELAGCSTFASATPEPFLAQTIDLPGALASEPVVLHAEGESLQLTFAGLLGYAGIGKRVAIGINMVLAGGWRPGIPAYLLVRRLLELESVEACLDELRRLPRASSRCYTIVDRSRAVQVETTCDAVAVLDEAPLAHTNHYLAASLTDCDRSHVVHRRESRRRLEQLAARVDRRASDDPESLFATLAAHDDSPICIHGSDDPRSFSTLAAIVLRPSRGELFARTAPICESPTQQHRLGGFAS